MSCSSSSSAALAASDKNPNPSQQSEGSKYAHLFVFSNEKAGMKKVDKDYVNQVIYEMTKDSPCFKNKQKLDAQRLHQVKALRAKVSVVTNGELKPAKQRVDVQVEKLKTERDFSRIKVVVDMDMFFAAVEMRENPSYIGKPIAVGGMQMISTANYEARKFGVRSAMPGFVAKKLCPDLIFVKSSFDKYKEASVAVKLIFQEYDKSLSPSSGSLDEAYLDLTDYVTENFDPNNEKPTQERMQFAYDTVNEIRHKVAEKTRLTCSAGIGCTSMIAKICSDINKPNGQKMVKPDEMEAFVHALPIRKIPGIGPATEKLLQDSLDIKTVADLWHKRVLCAHLFSENTSSRFLNICVLFSNGASHADAFQPSSAGRKSISCERTFSRGESDPQRQLAILKKVCKSLAEDCQKADVMGTTLTVKLKNADFSVKSRQQSYSNAFPKKASDGTDMYVKAKLLLEKEMPCKLRLLGVRVSSLVNREARASDNSPEGFNSIVDLFEKAQTVPQERKCPLCGISLKGWGIDLVNNHVDKCLLKTPRDHDQKIHTKRKKMKEIVNCPICQKPLSNPTNEELNEHIDTCYPEKQTTKPTKQQTILRYF